MEPVSHHALLAAFLGAAARGALSLTLEGRWGEFGLGLFWWSALGAALFLVLVVATRRVATRPLA